MTSAEALKILVLAHDLSDAAVQRRITMLKTGRAVVTVAGFRREPEPVTEVVGCPAVNFGRTYNAGFLQRIWSVIRETALLAQHRRLFAEADVVLARNLEMLAIAVRGRGLCASKPVIVYEALDIHRLLLRQDFIGAALRALEGRLSKQAASLVTSSPAFVDGYFRTLSKVRLPVRLVENKTLATTFPAAQERPAGPPWIIGWFGIIRCRKSLHILRELVQKNPQVKVVIRGKPSPDQFENFEHEIAGVPGIEFLGPYKNPNDLATMYNGVHFSWAIDMFEEGLNSTWLLPNRLYEGGAYNCVPLAQENVESGQFIKRLGIGVPVKEPLAASLVDFFKQLTPEKYRDLEFASTRVPRTTWVCEPEECKVLVDYMRSLKDAAHA